MNIVIENLTHAFVKQKNVLTTLNLTLIGGQITGLVGPDGAGKTTLLQIVAGLLKPTQGRVVIGGLDAIADIDHLRAQIGYMPQNFGLYEDLTVLENLNLYADLNHITGSLRAQRFSQLLEFTDLARFTTRLAGRLSGGMKQKLGLACVLIGSPKLLLLDEPCVGVDPISRRELWRMVSCLAEEGISVIWSTAYFDEAARCDSVLLINEGQLLYHGPPDYFENLETGFIELLGGMPHYDPSLALHFTSQMRTLVADDKPVMIEAEGLSKQFGAFTATDQISFTVHQGEIFGLLGPNGAGKSTTFKMMCGLLTPTSGSARVVGLDLKTSAVQARQKLGYMSQKFALYGQLTVLQNLMFFAGIYGLKSHHRLNQVHKMLDIFALHGYQTVRANTLALGYKQRLALACALMHNPDILFLDEPTSGVDPLTRKEFWSHINGLVAAGMTVMITTHFMDEAEYCDRIGLIYRGKLIACDTPSGLKERARSDVLPHPNMEDAFIQLVTDYDAH